MEAVYKENKFSHVFHKSATLRCLPKALDTWPEEPATSDTTLFRLLQEQLYQLLILSVTKKGFIMFALLKAELFLL